ncbi:ABC transporter permease [Aneurinibacillus aneurinilyticus]|jgi:hypothetical protein|uniref:ABC transporter permease subunit n=2 Tax=Aneurinibacillus aneurinilyticus TaxID=1391 RepID=A0A848D095_ANEAE|nr:ABC transporter permease [Aneurinibacillus aneurinilyticus]ERI09508.1 hypothetical protein HMPREF0083_02349 [Aneurinibacillus aneurinilyticus ATCC 12856]MCI1695708.1 ABC transporter permease [Aneurinibacillus aneurinilyticus]MED0670734.1 ABC transporter permease [Aneurinibacillus aneurinilyticus]MED0706680.1 ABC transporter permease [Aneurinibacillus aneurinilyticus]MED0722554.1 ABC transporter permease [Aneurinibacillus aneurinilyticus]
MLRRMLRSEAVKYRRIFMPALCFIAPLLPAMLALAGQYDPLTKQVDWEEAMRAASLYWFGLLLPAAGGLVAGYAAQIEAAAGDWKGMIARGVSRRGLYASKQLWLALCLGLSTAVLYAVLAVAAMPFPEAFGNALWIWGYIWLVQYAAALAQLFISLWIAVAWGRAAAAGFGFISIFLMLCWRSLTGVAYPGIPTAVLTFHLASLVLLCVMLFAAGAAWFHRKERTG